MTDLVYLNGDYLPLAEARIPVLDRGFIFGDGVYEMIPVYDRRPFRMDHHLDRLRHSLAGIRLANPHTDAEWQALMAPLIEQADWPDQGLYLQVTRGPAPRDHAFPKAVRPTVFISVPKKWMELWEEVARRADPDSGWLASAGLAILDRAELPYVLTLGNHDTAATKEGGSAAPGGHTPRPRIGENPLLPADRGPDRACPPPGRRRAGAGATGGRACWARG